MKITKRLLISSSSFPTIEMEDNTHFIYTLAKHLSKDFHICILCPHKQGLSTKEVTKYFTVYRYRYAPESMENLAYGAGIIPNIKNNPFLLFLIPSFFIGQLFTTMRIIQQENIDLIHAHWLIPQGLIAVIARFLSARTVKVLVTSHGADLYSLKSSLSQKIKTLIIKKANAITVVSNSMSKYINKELCNQKKEISIIPMGTDLKHLFVPSNTISRDTNTLLFVGRLVEKKGVLFLIKAFNLLLKKNPDLNLQIIGDGPEKEFLKKQTRNLRLSNRIQFINPLPHKELVTYYQKATIACFPFIIAQCGDQEGLGLVVVEAMGCKCPVIVGDVAAVNDTVTHNKTGLIVKPENIYQFSKTIAQLLKDKPLQKQLTEKAHDHVIKQFDWETITSKYKNTLINLK